MRNLTSDVRESRVNETKRNGTPPNKPLLSNPLRKENHWGGGGGHPAHTRDLCLAPRRSLRELVVQHIVFPCATFPFVERNYQQ
jgi:hypothetical protein